MIVDDDTVVAVVVVVAVVAVPVLVVVVGLVTPWLVVTNRVVLVATVTQTRASTAATTTIRFGFNNRNVNAVGGGVAVIDDDTNRLSRDLISSVPVILEVQWMFFLQWMMLLLLLSLKHRNGRYIICITSLYKYRFYFLFSKRAAISKRELGVVKPTLTIGIRTAPHRQPE